MSAAPARLHHSALPSHASRLRGGAVVKLSGARVYRGPASPMLVGDVWLQSGRIIDPAVRFWEAAQSGRFACDVEVDCAGLTLAPGFLDLQFNGGWGVDFSFAGLSPADIAAVLARVPSGGVTAVCPTVISSSAETYRAVLAQFRVFDSWRASAHAAAQDTAAAAAGSAEHAPIPPWSSAGAAAPARVMARSLGLHLEGPFINAQKKGAHAEVHINEACAQLAEGQPARPIDVAALPLSPPDAASESAALRAFSAVYGVDFSDAAAAAAAGAPSPSAPPRPDHAVRIVTLAPELRGGLALTSALARRGVVVSIGHTEATIHAAEAAVDAGACLVTHLFNAMSGFKHRNPGVPGLLGRRYQKAGRPSIEMPPPQASPRTAAAVPLPYALAASADGAVAAPATRLIGGAWTPVAMHSPATLRAAAVTPQSLARRLDAASLSSSSSSSSLSTTTSTAAAAAAAVALASVSRAPVSPFSPVPPAGTGAPPQALVRGALLGQPFYSLIVDNVHVHPASVVIAASTHPRGLVLVTDAVQALGLPPGRHTLGEVDVDIFAGGEPGSPYEGPHAVLRGTDTLAGAVLPLDACLRNLVACTRCDAATAIAAVTTHPAALLGLGGVLGTLDAGAWADVVLLDDELRVVHTLVAGELAFSASEALPSSH